MAPDLTHADPCRCTIDSRTGEISNDDRVTPVSQEEFRRSISFQPEQGTAWFCDTAKGIIGGDGQRRQDYGDALESFEAIAKLWSVVLKTDVTAEQVALCQAMVKMGRLLNTPNHTDSWVDIIGYAALGGDIAMRPGRNGNR